MTLAQRLQPLVLGQRKGGVLAQQLARDVGAERTSDAGNLKTVREAVVDENTARKGEYLRFVLHSAEGSRENESVKVALKLCSTFFQRFGTVLFSQTLGGDELIPFHSTAKVGVLCGKRRWRKRKIHKPRQERLPVPWFFRTPLHGLVGGMFGFFVTLRPRNRIVTKRL